MKLAAITVALAALCAAPAHAQTLTREDLDAALKSRDQLIAALQQRVAELERERAGQPAQVPTPATAATPTAAPAPAAATSRVSTTEGDDAALQALSRTLVQRGGLVLSPWRMEFIPSVAYSNREVQGLTLVQTPEGIPTVADQRLRQDQVRATAALRVGLPWASQIELQLPYNWLRQSRSLGDGSHAVNEGSGFGDVEVLLSHQFLRESGWRPDLVGGLSWRTTTGRDPFRTRLAAVATGSGLDEFRARLTAVKNSDPLVFFGTLSYAHDMAAHEAFGEVQPGDAIGLELGAVLALSPETSMTFGVSQEVRERTQIDRVGVAGTDTLPASLNLGVSRVLTPSVLLDVTLGVGLTRDAPDYALQISLPIRFR